MKKKKKNPKHNKEIKKLVIARLKQIPDNVREKAIIKEFIERKRCLTCGKLKGEGGELSDSCIQCLEEG